jgi:hypothetical protein
MMTASQGLRRRNPLANGSESKRQGVLTACLHHNTIAANLGDSQLGRGFEQSVA